MDMTRREFLGTATGSAVAAAVVGWPRHISAQDSGPAIGSVAGTLTHGASITLRGSRFGTKPAAAPVKFDDFQNLAVNRPLSDNGWDCDEAPDHSPVASTMRLRPGTPSTRNARCTWTHNDASSFGLWHSGTWTRVYFDGWMYFECLADPQPQNCKPIRFHQAGSGSPNAYLNFYGPTGSDSLAAGRDGVTGGPADSGWFGSYPANGIGSGNDVPARVFYNNWVHIQLLAHVGTPGVANGSWIIYLNSRLRWNRRGNIYLLMPPHTGWPELYFGNYVRSDPHGTTHAHWECAYVDNSWARVEIGDNANYNNCTHREIQIPSGWSDSSVTVTLNRGSFGPSAAAYLFVVDGNNTPSAGYPIQLGGGSGLVVPAAPTGVTIR
jgi:hypothetical protein